MHAFEEFRLAASRRTVALRGQPGSLEALHVAGLWAMAVVQPLFDLLGSNPEFLVAHNTRPTDLPGLLIALGLAGPACCLLATRLCHRLGPGWHSLATGIVTGTLVATVALATIRLEADWSRDASFGIAAVCGVLAAGGYVWSSTVRLFVTFLSPAAIIVPAVFLLNPAISPFLSKSGSVHAIVDGVTFDETPPVIVVVFDQLPLASLLNRAGEIDRTLYPHFAALADDTTWFRNASAVTEATTLALPAIVTGNYPTPGRVPVAADHPANLFTLFGARYRLQVLEPLTDLCPATLCAPDRTGAIAWLVPVLSDLAVVFLHQVLPAAAALSLPPVTQNWRDFAAPDTFLDRWNLRWDSLRVRGRRATAAAFIDALSADGQPTLHFAHLLLPHEPWHFLRTGQRFSAHRFSLAGPRDGIWPDDERAVAVSYQRHLLQVQYVDSLVGALAARLREAGIWDDALVVVTSDHGLSLRPGLPFLEPTASTFADIAAVPLFVKRPGQRRGEVVDANVEVIDILPTLAAEVGVELPWETDGVNVFAPGGADRTGKVMFVENGQKRVNGPGYLHDALMATVDRKFAIFPGGNPVDQPRLKPYDDLIGTLAASIRGARPAHLDVTLDAPYLLNDVEHSADFVPAHLTGHVVLPGRRLGYAARGCDQRCRGGSHTAVCLQSLRTAGEVGGDSRPAPAPAGRQQRWGLRGSRAPRRRVRARRGVSRQHQQSGNHRGQPHSRGDGGAAGGDRVRLSSDGAARGPRGPLDRWPGTSLGAHRPAGGAGGDGGQHPDDGRQAEKPGGGRQRLSAVRWNRSRILGADVRSRCLHADGFAHHRDRIAQRPAQPGDDRRTNPGRRRGLDRTAGPRGQAATLSGLPADSPVSTGWPACSGGSGSERVPGTAGMRYNTFLRTRLRVDLAGS